MSNKVHNTYVAEWEDANNITFSGHITYDLNLDKQYQQELGWNDSTTTPVGYVLVVNRTDKDPIFVPGGAECTTVLQGT
jgi:hypothetical protein